MEKTGPKNGEKGIWGHFSIFSACVWLFFPISGWVIFYCSAHVFPFSAFGPFSVLCQAA